eukprot:1346900-Amorphochlora_amoeboformis.AAC.1
MSIDAQDQVKIKRQHYIKHMYVEAHYKKSCAVAKPRNDFCVTLSARRICRKRKSTTQRRYIIESCANDDELDLLVCLLVLRKRNTWSRGHSREVRVSTRT